MTHLPRIRSIILLALTLLLPACASSNSGGSLLMDQGILSAKDQSAETSDTGRMNYTLIRLKGEIKRSTATEFLEKISKADSDSPLIIALESPGGDIGAAFLMADAIRSRKNTVTYLDNEGKCMSSCTLLFLASKNRYMEPGSVLGFHAVRCVMNTTICKIIGAPLEALSRNSLRGKIEEYAPKLLAYLDREHPETFYNREVVRVGSDTINRLELFDRL